MATISTNNAQRSWTKGVFPEFQNGVVHSLRRPLWQLAAGDLGHDTGASLDLLIEKEEHAYQTGNDHNEPDPRDHSLYEQDDSQERDHCAPAPTEKGSPRGIGFVFDELRHSLGPCSVSSTR